MTTPSRTRQQHDVEMLALDARQITRRLATHNNTHRENATNELRRIVETYAERRSADAVLARRLLGLVEQALDTPPWHADLEAEMRTTIDRADALIALAVTELATVKEQARVATEQHRTDLDAARRARTTVAVANTDDVAKFTADTWTVAALEETAHRLRVAGADDHTPVDVQHGMIRAEVVDPLLVQLDTHPTRETVPPPPGGLLAAARDRAVLLMLATTIVGVLVLAGAARAVLS